MSAATRATTLLRHGRITLALHQLRAAGNSGGHPLLLLHGLGESSPEAVPLDIAGWNGAIYALDFSGHGESSLPVAGGYSAEVLMGDVDIALASIGAATVFGRGLGGYVTLLIAGARPALVHGAIVGDGPGLSGGGTSSHSVHLDFTRRDLSLGPTPDPYALLELSTDIRPVDYVASFVQAAMQGSAVTPAVAVIANGRPSWLVGALEQYGAETMSLTDALAVYAAT
jgi:pimeloyl-ACP methyl ester carboxylesterase